ncbi:MAG TPA: carboxylating nicotinate-nucleotide diphosphorylase [Gemmatimonadales bacterium]|nr:carboxylating nicotinate-nucleotide diphosphorylase [Gemmatimonadales bacterium]
MTEAGGWADLARDAMRVATMALAEDGREDVTSRVTIGDGQQGRGVLEAREPMVVAGLAYADAVVAAAGLPPLAWLVTEGQQVGRPQAIGACTGPLRGLLRAERPLLNLLQRASGIATMTARCVAAVAGTGCRILHTRKTTPGLRAFEVRAVLSGGGGLHRLDLATAVMVKDNHWQALAASGRSLADALQAARESGVEQLEVEVESVAQLEEACRAGATRLLIDNQSPDVVAEWVVRARGLRPTIELEATGGITLATMGDYARTGIDFISTGMLTHSVRSADLGMEVTSP